MINKILIKQIINQLVRDISELTRTILSYSIEKENTYYKIIIVAISNKDRTTITKEKTIRIDNWIQLITNYKEIKDNIKKDLIINIKEDI